LIITLEPPDLVTVREKGRRKGFTLSIETIYILAAEAEVRRRKVEKRKKKRKVKRGTLRK
jgi:hypothetical protein